MLSQLLSSSMMVSGFGSGEMGDPAIKLFGKTIPLTENGPCSSSASDPDPDPDPIPEPAGEDNKVVGGSKVRLHHERNHYKDTCKETTDDEVKDTPLEAPGELEQGDQNSLSTLSNPNETDHQTSQDVVENSDPKSQQDQSEADVSGQEKVLKKPDKILPCPRCNSLDTKFCYYNNYNVNQPRHFCKNCQRYWTAGGTMRNVPVGAGRRKNKHSSSHYRHMMMSPEALSSAARGDASESTNRQAHSCGPVSITPLKGSGTVLKFGSEVPLCESMSSVLNLRDQKRTELSAEEPACASNCAESEFPENAAHKEPNGMHGYCNGFTPMNPPMHPMQCYPGPPWAYPWGPGWNNISAAAAAMAAGRSSSELSIGPEAGNMGSIQWAPPPMLAGPAFCAPTIPIPFMPPAFWAPGAWAVPWASPAPNDGLSRLSSTSNSDCSGNSSPTLGKHSRDANLDCEEKKSEKSLWVPKTLRIDDPDEAAKSSIWATLGIKPDEGGMFRAFQSRAGSKGQKSDAPKALCANPAAMSRSQSFQETT